MAPNPDESDGKMDGADDHPLVRSEFPTGGSSPIWWGRTHPRRQLGELHVLPDFLKDILPKDVPGLPDWSGSLFHLFTRMRKNALVTIRLAPPGNKR